MSIKSKIVTFVVASLLAGFSFATQNPDCPGIDAIKLEGFTRFEKVLSDLFFTYHTSQYGTDYDWAVVMAPIEADSGVMALSISNDILAAMTMPGVPLNNEKIYMCRYETGRHDVKVLVVLADVLISPAKIGKLFSVR